MGTGLNTHKGFAEKIAAKIAANTGESYTKFMKQIAIGLCLQTPKQLIHSQITGVSDEWISFADV